MFGAFDSRWVRVVIGLVVATCAAGVISAWRLEGGTAAKPAVDLVAATRGNVVVSVGGVGRVVEANATGSIPLPTAAGAGGTAAGGPQAAQAGSIFARSPGHISRFLVKPGQRVSARQAVAVLDDDGMSRLAVAQATKELATALLELQQKQASDPQKGTRATPAELAAGRLAVVAAERRLAQLRGPARAAAVTADVAAARADLGKAWADRAVLRGSASSPKAIAAAREALTATQRRLDKVRGPASPADLAAAQADVGKALADLVAVQQAASTMPEVLAAARESLAAAQARLDKAQGPASPADLAVAEAELRKAQSDLATLQADPTVVPEGALAAALTSAQAAVTAAQLKLDRLQGPADPADLAAVRAEIKKAEADVATVLRNPTTPEAVVAAQQAVKAAEQRLARLQGPPDPADVATARSDVRKAEADLATALKGPAPEAVAAADQAITAAQKKLARLTGPPLAADVTAATLDISKAKADLAVLQARGGPASPTDIGVAQLRVDAAQQRLDAARRTVRLLTVRAPWSGVVTGLSTVPGAPVDTSTPIATIADLDHLAVNVDLSEYDVAQVKRNMTAVVRVDALGGKAFPGKVTFVPFAGNDNGGVVTFPVRVGLTRAAGLKPGMNVSVRVIVAQRRGVVQVPVEAVARDDEDRAMVTIARKDGGVIERRVETGLANNKSIEIVRGLRPGQQLVLAAAGEEP